MQSPDVLVRMIAVCMLQGDWRADAMVERLRKLLGKGYRGLKPLAERVDRHFGSQRRPRLVLLIAFLRADRGLRRALRKNKLRIQEWTIDAAVMQPSPAAASWQIPAITSEEELAQWLGIHLSKLPWYADAKLLHARHPEKYAGHYRRYFASKKWFLNSDSSQSSVCKFSSVARSLGSSRLIEAPKRVLKSIQKEILYGIFESVPPHPSCCGFRTGSSIVDYAAPHVGKSVVLKMDLRDFYPSIHYGRVFAIFASLGYPENISRLLAQLSTTATPLGLWQVRERNELVEHYESLYSVRHLPQGAPSSPALANLAAYRLDCRLTGFAKQLGANYTRYADDLAFSGGEEFKRAAKRFSTSVAAIILEEGFQVNFRKTRIMPAATSQRLAGIIVNESLNIPRKKYDELKAILTNSIRFGLESQNRANHPDFRRYLQGRVAFISMINAEKGSKLRDLLQQVD